MKKTFEVTDSYTWIWGLIGEVSTSYKKLVELFWEPTDWEGYKVSTQWHLKYLPRNIDFYIYDYKETELYDSSYPTVDEFRKQGNYMWHIWGDSNVGEIFDEIAYYIQDDK